MCQYGHSVVRSIFDRFISGHMTGFVVFLPMLEDDSVELAEERAQRLSDSRVIHFGDPERTAGDLVSATLNLNSTAWDIYLVYPPRVKWTGSKPPPPSYWMHQLPSEYGVGDTPRLEAATLTMEVQHLFATA